MRRKVNLHNFMLKVTAGVMTCAAILSCICCQMDSWIPTAVCFGSCLWLGAFAYANGAFEDDDIEDGEDHAS